PVLIHRPHIGSIAGEAVAGGPLQWRAVLGVIVEEHRAEDSDHWNVEPVHPEIGPIAVMAMIVPGVARRDHEVAGIHVALLARHGGPAAAFAFDDEAQRRGRMLMR